MKRLLPRVGWGPWGGGDIDGKRDCAGWCLVVQWCGCIVEIGGGRIRA